MRHEILLNVTPLETRVAVVEQGMVQELLIERATHRGLVGNVYVGQVVRVLPGMQACFVEIGLERSAFLHAKHIPHSVTARDASISTLVTEGQRLLVQVTKDPIGTKGARLTAEVSLPARHLVLMPFANHVGISQRIEDDDNRDLLKRMAQDALDAQGLDLGVIVRTAGKGHTQADFEHDLAYLKRLWDEIRSMEKTVKPPMCVYQDLSLSHRVIRDQIRPETERVLVDSQETFDRMLGFSTKYVPDVVNQLQHYAGERPIFELYQIEDELERALGRRVELKSGAYMVIDETEAMTTVDVNTGGFVGAHTLEQTVFRTNLEAAVAIGRQLRLRNLGGIIVIDFIDMEDEEHRRQVFRTLERSLEPDPVKTRLNDFNDVGLVVLTRKRTRERLSDLLQEACPECRGTGKTKTPETLCYEIFRAILREARAFSAEATTVIAAPVVIDRLIDEESQALADLEAFIHRPIRLQVDANFARDRFEVVLA